MVKSSQKKNRSSPSKQRPGYDWVSDRRVKGGGYWRRKRSRLGAVAGFGAGVAKTIASGVAGTAGAIAGTVAANAGSAVLGAGLAAATSGLAVMAARARKKNSSPGQPPPSSQPPSSGFNKKAATVAAGSAGAAVAAALIRKKGVQSVNVEPPEESASPDRSQTPKTPNAPGGAGASTAPAAPGSSQASKAPKSPGVNSASELSTTKTSSGLVAQEATQLSSRSTPVSAGTAVIQKRASKTGAQMLLPQSAKTQQGTNMPGVADPWEGEVEPQQTEEKTGKPPVGASPPLGLPSASRRLSKQQLKKTISESRNLKSKRKRIETEIEKATNKIELGKSLQKKESDADKLRGIDYEMAASEKKANLEARLSEIQSREKQLNDVLSPKLPSQIGTTPLSGEGTITPAPKGMEVIEKRKQAKKGKKGKGGDASVEAAELQESSPVQSEETIKTKKSKRSIVQRVKNAISRKKQDPIAAQGEGEKETPRERRRRERAENKQLKKELIEQTGKSASKAMVRNAYKAPLNLVVPGLGDAVEKADRFFGDKSRIEKWAQELEDNGDINVSRRELFRGGRKFVAKQTAAKPKGITQELQRGAEISKDFFDQLVGSNTDEIILKGAKTRGFGADRGRRIQLTKAEYERITRTYTNSQKRQLLNFLDFIGFPVP